jgi:hypothetical protein
MQKFWSKTPPWVFLLGLLLLGAGMIILPASLRTLSWEWDWGIIRDLGTALSIAAMLGLTIDRWLKKTQIARDVFEAALGYVAPEEFREEIRRTASFRFLCDRHVSRLTIDDLGNGQVRVTTSTERTVRNISSSTEKLRPFLVLDEWGFDQPSEILECRFEFRGQSYSGTTKSTDHTLVLEGEDIDIPPGETVRIISKISETKRNNDDLSFVYLIPTRNPEIDVTAPDHIAFLVEFGRGGEKTDREVYGPRYKLQGTYFPSQHMRLRWWPKATSDGTQRP